MTDSTAPEQATPTVTEYVNKVLGVMPPIEMHVPVFNPAVPNQWEKLTVAITTPIEVDAYIHAVIKNTHEQFLVAQKECMARADAAQAADDFTALMAARCDEAALIGHHSALTATFEHTVRATLQKMLARDNMNEDRITRTYNLAWNAATEQSMLAGYQNGWMDRGLTQAFPNHMQ